MSTTDSTARSLPDVADQAQPHLASALEWVGMDNIQVPLLLADADGQAQRVSARVDAHVNLQRADARGIHMSRLYLMVEQALSAEALTPCLLRKLLRGFLDSHADLSNQAQLHIRFEQMVRRPALKSDNSGWRAIRSAFAPACAGRTSMSSWAPRWSTPPPARPRRPCRAS